VLSEITFRDPIYWPAAVIGMALLAWVTLWMAPAFLALVLGALALAMSGPLLTHVDAWYWVVHAQLESFPAVFVAACAGVFVMARRRKLITNRTVIGSVLLLPISWLGVAWLFATDALNISVNGTPMWWALWWWMIAFAALPMLPIAALPLWIQRQRHR